MGSAPKTMIVIPAFNEENSLPEVLAHLALVVPDHTVVVVDDGSSDRTYHVARRSGVNCLRLPFNLGIGGALRAGFRFAFEQGFDRVVQFDADGQHDAHQIIELLDGIDQGADLVIGSRFAGVGDYNVGRARYAGMGVLRVLVRALSGQKFTDTSSGFRAISRRLLGHFAVDYPLEYMDSTEALITACRLGYDVREVPVTMHERSGGEASNRSFRLVYNYLRLLVVLATSARRKAPALGENP
ncbi:MAG: glycosyltransferase family 2 protein [Acidimicrobiales bacterium]